MIKGLAKELGGIVEWGLRERTFAELDGWVEVL